MSGLRHRGVRGFCKVVGGSLRVGILGLAVAEGPWVEESERVIDFGARDGRGRSAIVRGR